MPAPITIWTASIAAALLVWLVAILAHRAYHEHYFRREDAAWRKSGFFEKFSLRHAVSAEIFRNEDDSRMSLYARLILLLYRILIMLFYLMLLADAYYVLMLFLS